MSRIAAEALFEVTDDIDTGLEYGLEQQFCVQDKKVSANKRDSSINSYYSATDNLETIRVKSLKRETSINPSFPLESDAINEDNVNSIELDEDEAEILR